MDSAGVFKVIAQPSETGMVYDPVVLSISVDIHVYSVPVSTLFHLNGSWTEYNWCANVAIYRKQSNKQGSLTDGLEYKISPRARSGQLPRTWLPWWELGGARKTRSVPNLKEARCFEIYESASVKRAGALLQFFVTRSVFLA